MCTDYSIGMQHLRICYEHSQCCEAVLQDIHKGDGLKNPINRVYSTNAAEPWHVDDADIVGKHPELGGEST